MAVLTQNIQVQKPVNVWDSYACLLAQAGGLAVTSLSATRSLCQDLGRRGILRPPGLCCAQQSQHLLPSSWAGHVLP